MDQQPNIQDEQELKKINQQMQARAKKFGAEFTPMTKEDFKVFKIKKASQTGDIKLLDTVVLDDIQDIKQRRKVIQDRMSKFFMKNVQIQQDPNKFFAEKVVPDFSEDNLLIRDNAWHLFGVDYMSNQRIKNYFHSNPHFKIQWLNDSACNIVYRTAEQAQEAIKPYLKGGQIKTQNQQIWYQLQQYEVDGVKRKLMCRQATNRDIKKQDTSGKNSKYYQWIKNKQKISNFVRSTAKKEIYKTYKTKQIVKKQKNHKKEEQSENSSSSGVSDSEEKEQKAPQQNEDKIPQNNNPKEQQSSSSSQQVDKNH